MTNFENLGRDSMMVVPCPADENKQVYSSIAPFMRSGLTEQINQFWKTVVRVMKEQVMKKVRILEAEALSINLVTIMTPCSLEMTQPGCPQQVLVCTGCISGMLYH